MATTGIKRGVLLLLLTAAVGCGVPWTVVKQSGPPSALKGVSSVAVSFDYGGLMVGGGGGDKPEAQWVAEKSAAEPNYETTWAELKNKWEATFMEGFAAGSPVPVTRSTGAPVGADAADLTVQLNRLQIGKYIVISAKASTVDVTETWGRGGQVVDQIRTKAGVTPSPTQPSIFQHVAGMGKNQGKVNGKFLTAAQK